MSALACSIVVPGFSRAIAWIAEVADEHLGPVNPERQHQRGPLSQEAEAGAAARR